MNDWPWWLQTLVVLGFLFVILGPYIFRSEDDEYRDHP
jgi:hypothetical protein